MSIRVMSRVWEESEHSGGKLLLLLALADYANDQGVCWPAVEDLARKARMSERHCQRVLRELEESGEVKTLVGGFLAGKKRANTYEVRLDKGDILSEGDISGNKGDAHDPTRVTPTSPQPSMEPSEQQPSITTASDGEAPSLPGLESQEDKAVSEVWNHYAGVFGDRLRVKELTPPRERMLKKALKAVGGDAEVCKVAINGLQSYRRTHPDGSDRVDLATIFETHPKDTKNLTDKIESWARLAESGETAISPSVPRLLHQRVVDRQVQVVEMYATPDNPSARERGEAAIAWLRENAQLEPVYEDGKVNWRRVEQA